MNSTRQIARNTEVLLVENHAAWRNTVHEFLNDQPDMQVVGEARHGRQAVSETGRLQPDVVIMDILLPLMNGIQATRMIKQRFPAVQVVVLSHYDLPQFVESMTEAGASGYVLKDRAYEDLPDAVRTVAASGRYRGQGLRTPDGRSAPSAKEKDA